jgi:hypothetical protein
LDIISCFACKFWLHQTNPKAASDENKQKVNAQYQRRRGKAPKIQIIVSLFPFGGPKIISIIRWAQELTPFQPPEPLVDRIQDIIQVAAKPYITELYHACQLNALVRSYYLIDINFPKNLEPK